MLHEPSVRRLEPRYNIAEWFGQDITKLSPEERQALGSLSVSQTEDKKSVQAPSCPFLQTLRPEARCFKVGGVCSIRRFDPGGRPVPDQPVVTVCPARFIQVLKNGHHLLSFVSEKMLDCDQPVLVRETPFLRQIAKVDRGMEGSELRAEAKEEKKKAGRIDWIALDPSSIDSEEPKWCAIETQAVYFSGGKMRQEFDAYAARPSPTLFPQGNRRPDYRSNGPKRLWPQLDVKVPVLRSWGKKVAVVVDRFFFENMNTLQDAFPRARNDRERRDRAEIIWFVFDYDESLNLKEFVVRYTDFEASRHALNATEPISKDEFISDLKKVVIKKRQNKKVFRL